MAKATKVPITVTISSDQLAWLEKQAAKLDTNKSHVVRQLITKGMK